MVSGGFRWFQVVSGEVVPRGITRLRSRVRSFNEVVPRFSKYEFVAYFVKEVFLSSVTPGI